MHIALCHFRVGETDGVSLEMEKWKIVLEKLGHKVFFVAGTLGSSSGHIISELDYRSPNNLKFVRNCYEKLTDYKTEKELQLAIENYASIITGKLKRFISEYNIDLIIPNNIFSLGWSIPAGIGFFNAIITTGTKCLAHHHDFHWEREKYSNPTCQVIKDYLAQYFPPSHPNIQHVTINRLAQKKLMEKYAINATVVPNVFDFSASKWVIDEYNRDFREAIGLNQEDILILQATRIVERKGIELAIELIAKMQQLLPNKQRVALVFAGMSEADSNYLEKLQELAKQKNVELIIANNLISHTRHNTNNIKYYSLWDSYAHADFVTYPSLLEGWGNQLIEAIFAKKPIVLYEYPVYISDIKPHQLKIVSLGNNHTKTANGLATIPGKTLINAAEEIAAIIGNKDVCKNIVENNYKIGKKNFSYETLTKLLKKLTSESEYSKLPSFPRTPEFREKNDVIREQHNWLTEEDVFLITYGDSINSKKHLPLETLQIFLVSYLKNIISYIHILPFYPYSSDDGFSILDYFQVNPQLGNWNDINNISHDFKLMFDAVINHISAQSSWFKKYLAGDENFSGFFIEAPQSKELNKVTRPRTTPLLTEFDSKTGKKMIWTTFSADQVDLNYKNPKVVEKIIELLIFYVKNGAKALRLDAIGYLWKEIGTNCIHLPKTHLVIQHFREILNTVDPEVLLITETNVPHEDNISYFGDGTNEAQLVYQFPLPPLVFNGLLTGNARHLTKWAKILKLPSNKTTFFNFLASHDGIGVMPAKGILSETEIQQMIEHVEENGGFVSYKTNQNGTKSPYELNINYFDALYQQKDSQDINIKRFIAAHAILLSIIGVPAIYIHSLLGSRNYLDGVKESGSYRSINRGKLEWETLQKELEDPNSLRYKIFTPLINLIKIRKKEVAFHPNATQMVLELNPHVFSLLRTNKNNQILALHNLSNKKQFVSINLESKSSFCNLLTNNTINANGNILTVELAPYETGWYKT